VECREVGQNREGGTPPLDFGQQPPARSQERGQLPHDFNDAEHANFRGVDNRVHSCFPHLRATHAEKSDVDAPPKRQGEPRGVHIAGGFTG